MTLQKLFGVFSIILLALPPVAATAAVFKTGEVVLVEEVTPDDLYAVGESLEIGGAVTGDAFVAGSTVVLHKPVTQNVFAAGETVTIAGAVGDDITTVGKTVTIRAAQADDIFAAGNVITLTSDMTATGDVYLAGQTIRITGATIRGDVRLASSNIQLGDGTTIDGNLTTYGANKPTLHDNVTVKGTTQHVAREVREEATRGFQVLAWVRGILAWFIAAVVLLYLFPAASQRIVRTVTEKPAQSFGAGVLILILIVPVAIALFVTLIGGPLGLLVLATGGTFLMSGAIYATLVIGYFTWRLLNKQKDLSLTWQHALLGAVVMRTVGLVPIIGWLLVAITIAATIGAVGVTHFKELRRNDS